MTDLARFGWISNNMRSHFLWKYAFHEALFGSRPFVSRELWYLRFGTAIVIADNA